MQWRTWHPYSWKRPEGGATRCLCRRMTKTEWLVFESIIDRRKKPAEPRNAPIGPRLQVHTWPALTRPKTVYYSVRLLRRSHVLSSFLLCQQLRPTLLLLRLGCLCNALPLCLLFKL